MTGTTEDPLHARSVSKHFTYISSLNSHSDCEAGTISTSIKHVRKIRQKLIDLCEVTQGYTGGPAHLTRGCRQQRRAHKRAVSPGSDARRRAQRSRTTRKPPPAAR